MKTILDVTCGGRSIWFNKTHPQTVYMDQRQLEAGFNPRQKWVEVQPDVVARFGSLPFPSGYFQLVVMDPPHIVREPTNSDVDKKYGTLSPGTWAQDLQAGLLECWRVLRPGGIFILKWAEGSVSKKEVLALVPFSPLFGHTTSKRNAVTMWFTFLKGEN